MLEVIGCLILYDELSADLVLKNGKIVTVDSMNSIAEAVAVKGNLIMIVGSNTKIEKVISNKTKVIDLQGKTVLPGLIDSHMHPGNYGINWVRGVECGPDVGSMSELINRIKKKADSVPEGSWILGYSLDDVKLGRYPTWKELDEASPKNPLYVGRRDGHIGLANTLALKMGGIDKNTADPPHGKIDKDEKGELTGVLRESAKDLVTSKIPAVTVEMFIQGYKHIFDEFLSLGLTTIHASMVTSNEFKALQELRKEGVLRLRFCIHASGRQDGMLEALITAGIHTPFGDDWLKLTEIEWVFDTSGSGGTGAYYKPYPRNPGNTGILMYDQDDITRRVVAAHKAGLRVGLDGIGDRGNDRCLDAIEAALKEAPRNDHRHRIEHCCYVTPPIQQRLKKLGVIDASATGFIYGLGHAYKWHRGDEEMQWHWPHRTLIDLKIPAPGHSDCPVCSPNPWLGIYGMVTRRTSTGDVLYAGEGVTPIEAIRAYTMDGAYAAWEEGVKGSIEAGKLADLVVLDRDPLTVPPEELRVVQTVVTMIDGKIVYQR
jgi:predicted amidohydrolase YtcJ